MVEYEQTRTANVAQIGPMKAAKETVTVPSNEKHKKYARYAYHCLITGTIGSDPRTRDIQREMALEWLKLAEALLQPLKP